VAVIVLLKDLRGNENSSGFLTYIHRDHNLCHEPLSQFSPIAGCGYR